MMQLGVPSDDSTDIESVLSWYPMLAKLLKQHQRAWFALHLRPINGNGFKTTNISLSQ
jgi:hypothetical protein